MTPPFLKSCLKAPPLTSRLQKKQELVISFLKTANNFLSLNINSGQLEVVTNAWVLGLTISYDMAWNDHVANIIKNIYILSSS